MKIFVMKIFVILCILVILISIFDKKNIEKFTENSIYRKLLKIHKKIDKLQVRVKNGDTDYIKHINAINNKNNWMYSYHKILANPNSDERQKINKKARDKMMKDAKNNEEKIKKDLQKKYAKDFHKFANSDSDTELNASSNKTVNNSTINKYSSTKKSSSNLSGVVSGSSKLVDDDKSKNDLTDSLQFPKF